MLSIQKGDAAFIQAAARFIDEYEQKLRAEKKYFPRLNSRKIDNESMMNYMLFMIENNLSWNALQRCIDEYHYQSVYQRFQRMVKLGIFKYIWNKFLHQYSIKKLAKNPNYFMNLFTDTTMIKSLQGTDCIGRNPTDRGRNGTKVSVIVDQGKVAISECVMFPANVHDLKTLMPTMFKVPIVVKTDKRRTIRIAADKAYRNKDLAQNVLRMKIRLVTEPIRPKDKALYRKRVYIEHFFGMIKNGNKRIRVRVDRKIETYNALWYLAMARRTFNETNR